MHTIGSIHSPYAAVIHETTEGKTYSFEDKRGKNPNNILFTMTLPELRGLFATLNAVLVIETEGLKD